MKELRGTVLDKNNGLYIVALENYSQECKNCALSAICKANRSKVIVAKSKFELKKGEKVELFYPETSLILVYAIIFLLPVFLLIITLSLTNSFVLGGIIVIASFFILRAMDRWLTEKLARPQAVPLNRKSPFHI